MSEYLHMQPAQTTIIERLKRLTFSLESAMDVGDDAIAQSYEGDIQQILDVHPNLIEQ